MVTLTLVVTKLTASQRKQVAKAPSPLRPSPPTSEHTWYYLLPIPSKHRSRTEEFSSKYFKKCRPEIAVPGSAVRVRVVSVRDETGAWERYEFIKREKPPHDNGSGLPSGS